MKIPALILFLFALGHGAFGQLVAHPAGERFGPRPKFNAEEIAERGIVEIRLKEEIKQDGRPISSTGLERIYRFDEGGRPVSVSRITPSDTLRTFFEYAGGRLECEVHNEAAGMFSYCYVYGEEGLPVERKHRRTGGGARPGRSAESESETRTEKLVHTRYPGQLHTEVLNPSGRPYRKETRYFDGDLMTRYLSTFTMSGGKHDEKYGYDDLGRMVSKEVLDGRRTYRETYAYDDLNRLIEMQLYEGDGLESRTEYVYHSVTGTLTAELKREERKERIRITTYYYTFR